MPHLAEAADWYTAQLGFEPVHDDVFWANGVAGGPLQISADGGTTMLALFEASEGHPLITQQTGVAFSVDTETFIAFARSLPGAINGVDGMPLERDALVDFDLCWAYDLTDPCGNRFELNCYDYEQIATDLVAADAITPVRYWPRATFDRYRDNSDNGSLNR